MASGGEWKEFLVDDLFLVLNGKRLTKNDIVAGDMPYISSSSFNNGIQEYIGNTDGAIYSDCLSIAYNGKESAVFYHGYQAVFSDNVRVVKFRKKILKDCHYLYLASIFKKVRERFNYGNPMSSEKLKMERLSLPTKQGKIAFEYIESYMRELQKERLRELQLYLKATGLSSYELTDDEINTLEMQGGIDWQLFRIENIFDIETSKKKFNANTVTFDGDYPYVARGDKNNGIRGYITQDTKYLNRGKTISFGQDTATMFYQETAYFTGDKIKVFSLCDGELNRLNSQFLITSMRKAFSLFTWGSMFNENNLKQTVIQLPSKNNNPDYDFMATYIRAVQKLVIKDVVDYANRELSAYEQVIG